MKEEKEPHQDSYTKKTLATPNCGTGPNCYEVDPAQKVIITLGENVGLRPTPAGPNYDIRITMAADGSYHLIVKKLTYSAVEGRWKDDPPGDDFPLETKVPPDLGY